MEKYVGPVFFVVHAPFRYPGSDVALNNLAKANEKRIVELLNKAGLRRIPVVFSPELPSSQFFTGESFQGTINYLINKVKHKPRVIEVNTWGFTHFQFQNLVSIFKREGITPTQVTIAGVMRNACCINWAETIREQFPKLRINLLEGSYTAMTEDWHGDGVKRREFVARAKQLSVKRTKKLNPRHFV